MMPRPNRCVSTKPVARPGHRSLRWGLVFVVVFAAVTIAINGGEAAADDGNSADRLYAAADNSGDDEPSAHRQEDFDPEPGRRRLEQMSRSELEEQGFVFEDTLTERERAHATLFAMTAGAILPGAGHWHLEDRNTAMTLVGVDLTALGLIGAGIFLAVRPLERPLIDNRRHELWYLGTGLLATSWLIDIFGTAYRDELGIPASTRRSAGYGAMLKYHYWQPRDRSMRHVTSAVISARSPELELQARTSQELGLGMSDYEIDARWFPFVGTTTDTRAGVGVSGRYHRYRLDDPHRRAEFSAQIHTSLNLGRISGHLDRMTAGIDAGVTLRGHHQIEVGQPDRPLFSSPVWRAPIKMFLELNLTDQLRLRSTYQRGTTHWLGLQESAIGIPSAQLTYRSTDRVDLKFFAAGGEGFGLGAGIQGWFGE